jgi:hypothetical protein
MKTKRMLYAAVSALLLSSCEKESDLIVKSGTPASLELSIKCADVNTRGVGTLPSLTDEYKVARVTVGLFDADNGKTDAIVEGTLDTGTTTGKITVRGTAGLRDVIVVLNAQPGVFKGITDKTKFLQQTVALTQKSNEILMSGQADDVTLTAGATATPSPVTVSRLVSRIDLVSLKTAFDPTGLYSSATFKADKVFLYNAMSLSTVSDPPVTSAHIHGFDGEHLVEGLYANMSGTSIVGSVADVTPYFFYTFANSVTDISTATKLVIKGEFTAYTGATPVTVYYPVIINKDQLGTVREFNDGATAHEGILRNHIYKVSLTIKSIGVTSISSNLEPADITLTISISAWKGVTQSVEY